MNDEQECRICGDETPVVFNIRLKAVPVCERCAQLITVQQVQWWCAEYDGGEV